MKIGIFSRTYETGDLQETCRRMTADGIFHSQFNFQNAGLTPLPEAFPAGIFEEIRTVHDAAGISLDALTGTFNMIAPGLREREAGICQFELQCAAAEALGIPLVTLCTGSRSPRGKWTWDDSNLADSAWADLLRTTEQILKSAERHQVILGVETEASNIVNTPKRARKYLDQMASPNLKIVMDGANLFRPEQVPHMREVLDEAFDLLGKDIVSAHAKDFSFDGSLKFVAAGQGMLDFPYYLAKLKEVGYDGTLIMHGLSEAQVPASKQFLEELF